MKVALALVAMMSLFISSHTSAAQSGVRLEGDRWDSNTPEAAWSAKQDPASPVRLEKAFQVAAESEVVLDLTAAGPGTSWGERGREAAVATVFIDGRYHQDIILFEGARAFTYSVLLGHLTSGTHTLHVEYNRKQSASNASTLEVKDAKISTIDSSIAEYQALSHAPILYARPNTIGRFTDAPLLSWYEIQRDQTLTTIRYSIIFTNEDGGTQTNALMARWGRTTDIEYIYQIQLNSFGHLVSSVYQGTDHKEDWQFAGKKENDHPLFIVATDNNLFSDNRESEMRYALRPIPFDLSHASREELMFQHPWIYPLMVDELQRENKINEAMRVGQQIADPRRYLYMEAGARQKGTALSFAVKLKGDPKWFLTPASTVLAGLDNRIGQSTATLLDFEPVLRVMSLREHGPAADPPLQGQDRTL